MTDTITAPRPKLIDQLNPGQLAALEKLIAFLDPAQVTQDEFVLVGYGGTGKTFLMRALVEVIRGRLIFTAPTNKATKVLRETLTDEHYKPDCRTIYSLLGLKMQANNEIKELSSPDDPVDLSRFVAVVLDEVGMVGADLKTYIDQCRKVSKIKFIYMGDDCQLNPVKEAISPIWKLPTSAALTEIMRNGGAIAALGASVRSQVGLLVPRVNLAPLSTNDGITGVWLCDPWSDDFNQRLLSLARAGKFFEPTSAKVIAWRNTVVDRYNQMIRAELFADPNIPWQRGDRVVATAPADDLEGNSILYTDAEGTVVSAVEDKHPLYPEFKVWFTTILLDENRAVGTYILHGDSAVAFNHKKASLISEAKVQKYKWKDFWALAEAFHQIRHAYAITTHRSQGSTYDTVFLDWRDILSNPNRQEAYRALYVGVSRPRHQLVLN